MQYHQSESHHKELAACTDEQLCAMAAAGDREAEELLDEARAIVTDSVLRCLDKNITDWSKIKNIIKDDLSEYLWKKMKRNPMILPIIMEVE